MAAGAPTYWDYLKLDRLLDLQGGLDDDESRLPPDELHFIVVHQTYELWFKLLLAELRLARDRLAEPAVPESRVPFVVRHLWRAAEILRLAVQQMGVMETLTPQDFLAFRDKLIPASGFQSFQMREIEIVLGLDESRRARYGQTDPLDHIRRLAQGSPGGARARTHLERALGEISLRTALHEWLYRTPVQGSSPDDPDDDATVDRFVRAYLEALAASNRDQLERLARSGAIGKQAAAARLADEERSAREFLLAEDVPESERPRAKRVRAGVLFVESYRELPLLAWPRALIDTVVDLEEQLVLFRSRHARMVERLIGRRTGTGGSSGVEYLDETTRQRIFVELWAVRTMLLPRAALPGLEKPEAYGFVQSVEIA